MQRNGTDNSPVNTVPTLLWPIKTQNIPKRVTNGEPNFIWSELTTFWLTQSLFSIEGGDFVYVLNSKGFAGQEIRRCSQF